MQYITELLRRSSKLAIFGAILGALLLLPAFAAADPGGLVISHELDRASIQVRHTPGIARIRSAPRGPMVRSHAVAQVGRTVRAVPELDPGAAGAALVLLIGGALVLIGDRRKNEA